MIRKLLAVAAICALPLAAQTKKILITNPDPQELETFQKASSKVRVVAVKPENVMQEIGDADAFIGNIKPEEVRAGKNLKWVAVMSAGVEQVLFKSGSNDLRDSNIVLTNNKVVQGPEIADHALAMLLTLTRGINTFIANQKQENWQPRPYPGIELRGKTAVVIGVGGIGTQIAVRANAFGMDIIGVDPEDKPFMPFIKKVVKPDQLDEVLPLADVVFISTPDTPKSHKMMGSKQFDLMKNKAYFIAVSRGGIYDMNSLVRSLDSRKLSGAGVDVVDPEPLPKGHALWKFDNAIVTPHIAGRSDMDRGRMIGTIADNIRRFADGQPLLNVVDKQKGY
jgi:phosphoglycerate dehydrogenase-like enzyme